MVQITNHSRSIIRLVSANPKAEPKARFSMNRDATVVIGDSDDMRREGQAQPVLRMSDAAFAGLGPLNHKFLDVLAAAGDISVDKFNDLTPAPAPAPEKDAGKK
ncbi:MAG: hypothetical protein HOP09_14625 [Hyphomicrobium sp.]|nr:hypothetical protein [Hyphomicrobium sp.]